MDQTQNVGSVQYAFGPDGTLVTSPVLMDDPATGKIICAACRVSKSERSFLTMPPYDFKSPFCLDCERPRPDQPPPSSLGKRGFESEAASKEPSPDPLKKAKGKEKDDQIELTGPETN